MSAESTLITAIPLKELQFRRRLLWPTLAIQTRRLGRGHHSSPHGLERILSQMPEA